MNSFLTFAASSLFHLLLFLIAYFFTDMHLNKVNPNSGYVQVFTQKSDVETINFEKNINPEKEKVDEPVFMTIPELVARSRGVIAFEKNEEGIRVGMTDPNDLEIRDNLEKRFGAKVVPPKVDEYNCLATGL